MQEQEQITTTTTTTQITEQEQAAIAPDVIYKNNIYALVDDVKQEPRYINKTDEELKADKSFFPVLVDYIYINYIGELLGNKTNRHSMVYKDIYILNDLFNIYTELVYLYKWNNKPNILEFGIFTGISRDTFYQWLNGLENNYKGVKTSEILTSERSDVVKKWFEVCERALIDGSDTIRDIFILKAKHGYRDNNNDIQITVNHKQIITSEELPALIGVKNGNN